MAKTNNYYWWTPEKWADVLLASGALTSRTWVELRDMFADMTHHERRLFIKGLLKDVKLSHYVRGLNVSSNRTV